MGKPWPLGKVTGPVGAQLFETLDKQVLIDFMKILAKALIPRNEG